MSIVVARTEAPTQESTKPGFAEPIARDREIATAVGACRATGRVLVVIRGRHGSGRSTVLGATCARLERDVVVLRSAANYTERSSPYAALMSLLQPGSDLDPVTAGIVSSARADLVDLLDGIGPQRPVEATVVAAGEILRPVVARCRVIAVDDAGWVDEFSASALVTALGLAGDSTDLGLALVTGPPGLAATPEPFSHVAAELDSTDVPITDLSRSDAIALARASRRGPMTERDLDAVWRQARGHAGWTVAAASRLQPVVEEAPRRVDHLIDQLGPGHLSLCQALAVGDRWPLALLAGAAQAAGVVVSDAPAVLDRLVEHGWMEINGDVITTSYPALRDALVERIGRARRWELHARLLEVLRTHVGTNPRLRGAMGPHLEVCATASQRDLRDLIAAADEVFPLDVHTAQRWYARAEALAEPGDACHAYVLVQLMRCRGAEGDDDGAARYGEAAAATGVLSTEQHLDVLDVLIDAGRIDRAVQSIESLDSIHASVVDRNLVRARVLTEQNRFHEASGLLEEALDRATLRAELAMLDGALSTIAQRSGDIDRRDAHLRNVVRSAAGLPPAARLTLLHRGAVQLAFSGSFSAARDLLERAEAILPLVPASTELGAGVLAEAVVAWSAGDWDRAVELTRPTVTARPRHRVLLSTMALRLASSRGLADEAESIQRELAALPRRPLFTDAAVAAHRLSLDADDPAIDSLEQRCRADLAEGRLIGVPYAALVLVEAGLERCREDRAADWADRLVAIAEVCPFPLTLVCAARARSLVDGTVAAAEHALEESRSRGYAALALLSAIEVGERAGDRELLRQTHERLADLGAVPMRRRAARALRALGSSAPRQAAAADDELTRTEHELVNYVRSGLTNRQVAAAMGLKPKTVEAYLTRIYTKLGTASRVELIVRLQNDDALRA